VRALLALFNLAAHLSAAKSQPAETKSMFLGWSECLRASSFSSSMCVCVCILASAKNSWGQKRIIAWQRALVTRRHGRRRGTKVLSSLLRALYTYGRGGVGSD
jgi:hypothetical protein